MGLVRLLSLFGEKEKVKRKMVSHFSFLSQEKMAILDSYGRKAKITTSMLNSLEGVLCKEINGALYGFPSIKLPRKAIEAAKVSYKAARRKSVDSI